MNGSPEEQDWEAYPPGAAPPHNTAPQYPPQYPPQSGPPPGYRPLPAPVPGLWPGPYGPPPGYGHGWYPPPAWPYGPGRPSIATAAAVLGFVTAGLTVLVSGAMLIAVLHGEDDAVSLLLTLGLPCAAGLVAGGLRLLDRRSPALLFGSAVGCGVVLVVAWLAGAATIDRTDGMQGLTVFVVTALVLPALTGTFSWLPTVREWAAAPPT